MSGCFPVNHTNRGVEVDQTTIIYTCVDKKKEHGRKNSPRRTNLYAPHASYHGKIHDYCYFCHAMKYASFLVSILIIIAVLIPGGNLPDVRIGGYDKLIHIAMFLGWALVVQYDFGTRPLSKRVIYFITGSLFSAITEILQILVEGRSFDVYDMIADMIGLIAGLLVGGPVVRWLKRFLFR